MPYKQWTQEQRDARNARRREQERRRQITQQNTPWPKQEPPPPPPVETWMYSQKVMKQGFAGKLVVQSRGVDVSKWREKNRSRNAFHGNNTLIESVPEGLTLGNVRHYKNALSRIESSLLAEAT